MISRVENILKSLIDGTEYKEAPMSRVEDLLIQLSREMPDHWSHALPDWLPTNGTFMELIESLEAHADETFDCCTYMGGVSCTDLPENMRYAELRISIMRSASTPDKRYFVYLFELSSTDSYPNLWTAMYYQHHLTEWQTRPFGKVAKLDENTNFEKNVTVNGNLSVKGTSYITHSEDVYTKQDLIHTREGAMAPLGPNSYTGLELMKYDGTKNGNIVYGSDGFAKVGDGNSLQDICTRNNISNMYDGCVLIWDSINKKAITKPGIKAVTEQRVKELIDTKFGESIIKVLNESI